MTFKEYFGDEAIAGIRQRFEDFLETDSGFLVIGNFAVGKNRVTDAYMNVTDKRVLNAVDIVVRDAVSVGLLKPVKPVVIADLTPDDIGREVVYNSSGGDKHEHGRIKSWNDSGVFVVYNEPAKLPNWQDYTAAHTSPEDLEFADES